MDTNFETYVTRINYTLENVIVPQIQSDFIRSQVFAVMELLHQLTSRLEYRHELLLEDIERLRGIIQTVIKTFSKHKIHIPEDILSETDIQAHEIYGKPLMAIHDRLEVAVGNAINLFYKNRDQIKNPREIEHHILVQISSGITRDVTLFKPEMMHELSEKYQKKEA